MLPLRVLLCRALPCRALFRPALAFLALTCSASSRAGPSLTHPASPRTSPPFLAFDCIHPRNPPCVENLSPICILCPCLQAFVRARTRRAPPPVPPRKHCCRHCDGVGGKERVRNKRTSSSRSSRWKSGNLTHNRSPGGLHIHPDFLKLTPTPLKNCKTSPQALLPTPLFPPLPQPHSKLLCIASALCANIIPARSRQALRASPSSTVASSRPSSARRGVTRRQSIKEFPPSTHSQSSTHAVQSILASCPMPPLQP